MNNLEDLKEYKKSKNINLRNKIVMNNYRLVTKIVSNYNTSIENNEELINEGILGLIKAIDQFDPEKGFKFSTLAVYIIKNAIRDYIHKNVGFCRFINKSETFRYLYSNLYRYEIHNECYGGITHNMCKEIAIQENISLSKVIAFFIMLFYTNFNEEIDNIWVNENPIDIVEKQQLHDEINRITNIWSDNKYLTLKLQYFEEKTVNQTAYTLRCSKENIKVHRGNNIRQLREGLKQYVTSI